MTLDKDLQRAIETLLPSGAPGGCLHGGASFKVEKPHFAARKKDPENRKNEVKLRTPLCRPLKHSMMLLSTEDTSI